jgi:hypothetical protein
MVYSGVGHAPPRNAASLVATGLIVMVEFAHFNRDEEEFPIEVALGRIAARRNAAAKRITTRSAGAFLGRDFFKEGWVFIFVP